MVGHRHTSLRRGFTLVELLIVIVIISILAAITIVAYNGIQARARDSARLSDFSNIKQLLALYRSDNNSYPSAVPNPGASTWELSSDPGFLDSLNAYKGSKTFSSPSSNGWYRYRTFAAGQYGCPVSQGNYYVLWFYGMETQTGTADVQTNGCTGQTLFSSAYTNNPAYKIEFVFLN